MIKVSSNVTLITGKSNLSSPTYNDNTKVDLTINKQLVSSESAELIGNSIKLTNLIQNNINVNKCKINCATNQISPTRGKNILDMDNNVLIDKYVSNKISFYSGCKTVFAPIIAGKTYTVSKSCVTSRFTIGFTKVFPTVGVAVYGSLESTIVKVLVDTAPVDCKYIVVYYWSSSDTGDDPNIQVELGSDATSYEPFVSSDMSPDHSSPITGTTKITVSDYLTPLDYILPQIGYSLPNGVCDTFETVTGVFTQNIGKAILNGGSSETTWQVLNTYTNTVRFAIHGYSFSFTDDVEKIICDKFQSINNSLLDAEHIDVGDINYSGYIIITVLKSRLTGYLSTWTSAQKVVAFKKFLANNPVTVLFQLDTPITNQYIPLSIIYPETIITITVNTGLIDFAYTNNFYKYTDYVQFDDGFNITGDFSLEILGEKFIPCSTIAELSNGNNKIELLWMLGRFIVGATKETGNQQAYVVLNACNSYACSRICSTPMAVPSDTEQVYILINHKENLFDLKVTLK